MVEKPSNISERERFDAMNNLGNSVGNCNPQVDVDGSRHGVLYDSLFNNSDYAIFYNVARAYHMGSFLETNDLACSFYGYTKEEFEKLAYEEIISPKSCLDYSVIMDKLSRKGRVVYEDVHTTKRGSNVPVEVTSYLINEKRKRKVLSIVRDISKRKNAELLSEMTRDKYRCLFKKAPITMLEVDISSLVSLINSLDKDEIFPIKKLYEKNHSMLMRGLSEISIVDANDAAFDLFGTKSFDDLVMEFRRVILDSIITYLEKHVGDLDNGYNDFVGKIGLNIRNMGQRYVSFRYTTLSSYDHKRAIITFIDITKKHKAEEKVKSLNIRLRKYARKLKYKINRIEEKRVPLTDNEKLAFYGLLRYPNLTSREIGEKVNMQTATVNSIKNRLKKEGYFKKIYLPRFDIMCNCLLTFSYGVMNYKKLYEGRINSENYSTIHGQIAATPEVIYYYLTEKDTFSMILSKDWVAFKEKQDMIDLLSRKNGMDIEENGLVHFPSGSTKVDAWFNFSPFFRNRFDIKINLGKETDVQLKDYKLTHTEKVLIMGLIQYPELSVAELSKRINLSVPTVCKLRERLLDVGVLKLVNFPVFKKIGVELIVMTHYIRNERSTQTTLTGDNNTDPSVFFSATTQRDAITIALYKNYAEAQTNFVKYRSNYDRDYVCKQRIIVPMEKLLYDKFEYAPIVKSFFDLD